MQTYPTEQLQLGVCLQSHRNAMGGQGAQLIDESAVGDDEGVKIVAINHHLGFLSNPPLTKVRHDAHQSGSTIPVPDLTDLQPSNQIKYISARLSANAGSQTSPSSVSKRAENDSKVPTASP